MATTVRPIDADEAALLCSWAKPQNRGPAQGLGNDLGMASEEALQAEQGSNHFVSRLKRPRITPSADVSASGLPARGGRGLKPQGQKDVGGFEAQGLRVAAKCGKKLPKTQSWCFVPLIYSALGLVPERLQCDGISTAQQVEEAQQVWSELFSHWPVWRAELRRAIEAYGISKFELDFLPRGNGGSRAWTTSLVYGEPQHFGRLPHPHGRCQDTILNMLPCDTQNQIFASVIAITSD